MLGVFLFVVNVTNRKAKRNKFLMFLSPFISLLLLGYTTSSSSSGAGLIYSVMYQKYSHFAEKSDFLPLGTAWKAPNYASFSALTRYWLKLGRIGAKSSVTIYMGFASKTANLLNGVTVGEAPHLSKKIC
jgi:hypothetical protein